MTAGQQMRPRGTAFLLTILTVGLQACSTPSPINMNVQVPQVGMGRLTVSAALIIPDSVSAATQQVQLGCGPTQDYIIPVGKQIERGARQALSQIVDNVRVVKDSASAIGEFDLLFEPTVPAFTMEVRCTSRELMRYIPIFGPLFGSRKPASPAGKLETQVAFQMKVSDKTGQTLFEEEYLSGKYSNQYFKNSSAAYGTMDNNVTTITTTAERSLAELLQEMTRGLVDSKKVFVYAQSVSGKGARPQAATARTSDVDNPPARNGKALNNHYAVVIGIEQYREGLPKADFARRDALIMSRYLTKTMGYPDQNVAVLLDDRASLTDMVKYIENWLPNRVDGASSVFIYYSGHGTPHVRTGDAYLVPYDGDPTFLQSTAYSLKRLYTSLETLPAKEILVVLDSCFSGTGGRSVIAKGTRPMVISVQNPLAAAGKTVVLAASTGEQSSNTHYKEAHGLMTYFFLKGLSGEADLNQDGRIDISELFGYISPQVQSVARRESNTDQTPQLLGSQEMIKRGITLVSPGK